MGRLVVAFQKERWPLRAPFRFAGHTIEASEVVVVTLSDGEVSGRGEATGVIYRGETPDSICAQIASLVCRLEDGMGRDELQRALPAGGARNAIDCALWDLTCKRAGRTIWELLGMTPVEVVSCNTVGLDPIAEAHVRAASLTDFHILKVKADRQNIVGRLRSVRAARPDARLFIDANGAWDISLLASVAEPLAALGVEMIEQPLPAGNDAALAQFDSPVPICADESCFVAADARRLVDRYDLVNIKLDKSGGLTEALELVKAARAEGLGTMVGNMIGTSLSMAPSYVVAQGAAYVDLDGPTALIRDRADGLSYHDGRVSIPEPPLWG
jgi:L-alanine-DL-glutamate epimerase-like enolase superfamily enzyme